MTCDLFTGDLDGFQSSCTILDLDNGDLTIPPFVVQDEVLPQRFKDALEDGLLAHVYNDYSKGARGDFSSSKFKQMETRKVFHDFMTDLLAPSLECLNNTTMEFEDDAFLAHHLLLQKKHAGSAGGGQTVAGTAEEAAGETGGTGGTVDGTAMGATVDGDTGGPDGSTGDLNVSMDMDMSQPGFFWDEFVHTQMFDIFKSKVRLVGWLVGWW